jgi:hypothetical protein
MTSSFLIKLSLGLLLLQVAVQRSQSLQFNLGQAMNEYDSDEYYNDEYYNDDEEYDYYEDEKPYLARVQSRSRPKPSVSASKNEKAEESVSRLADSAGEDVSAEGIGQNEARRKQASGNKNTQQKRK